MGLSMNEHAMPSRSVYAGLGLVTMSTLMYEIALTRIFSVTLWYHFAFVAISVALFGMTVGALLVHHRPAWFADDMVGRRLAQFALAFAVSIPVCFVTQLALPMSPHLTLVGLWSVLLTCIIISIPFVLSGVVVALVLTRYAHRVNRLYAADLAGAALGCVLLVAMLQRFDGPSAVIGVAAVAALGAVAFGAGRGRWARAVPAVVAVACAGFAVVNAVAVSNGHGLLRIVWAKEAQDPPHTAERWNAFSRVTVDGPANAPSGITIDSTAGTAMQPDTPETAEKLRGTIPNLVHHIRHDADVLVIGAGGGTDVRSSLVFDQKSVTGVEINPLVMHFAHDVYGDYTGHLDRNPKVTLVNDEARSWVRRHSNRFDIIQISLIDTWAAQGAGAFALTENSLYTVEAWKLFFSRLNQNGVMSVTRYYQFPGTDSPLEMYRTTALAAEALTEMGVKNPRDHLLIYRTPEFAFNGSIRLATLLVSPQPFTDDDRATLAADVESLGFEPVLTPDMSVDPMFERLAAEGGPSAAVDSITEDVSPPTDNRPFFFQMASLSTFLHGKGFGDNFVVRPVLVLTLLAFAVVLMALALLVVPNRMARRKGERPIPRAFSLYFAGIGLAFLLVEVSMLQRLGLFLGNPTYSLAVVLFTVLLFSGLGSMITERVVDTSRPRSLVVPLGVLTGLVVLMGNIAPWVLRSAAGSTTPTRVAIAVLLLAPLSTAMGMPFVIGMRAAGWRGEPGTALMWGINGAASVCASVLGVAIAVFFGIAATFWTGAAAYLLASVMMSRIVRAGTDGAAAAA